MIEEIINGIIGAISDIALSILTPILHVPAYAVSSLVNSGLAVVMPLIEAINYVGSAAFGLMQVITGLLIWMPPWLYVPIAAILILRAVMAMIAIATKIGETLLLRGWI